MSAYDIVRAWKDERYRDSVGIREGHPSGPRLVNLDRLDEAVGGGTEHLATFGCCNGMTTDPGLCSFFCGSNQQGDQTYGCCTPDTHLFCGTGSGGSSVGGEFCA